MSDKPRVRVGSNWKRPPTKVYDYNYDVGQHYYQPMIRHLDKKSAGVSSDSPGPMSFAERLAEDPLYGRSKPANYVSSDYSPANSRGGAGDGPSSRRPSAPSAPSGDSYKDYLADDDDFLGRHRPRMNLPSVSDQILESAGCMKSGDKFFDDALAEIRSKRRPLPSDVQDLTNDSFFSKDMADRSSSIQDSLTKRRNMLRDLDSELEKIDSGLEKYASSRARASAIDDLALTSSMNSQLSSSSSTSMNVKKRSVKTTMTTETTRY
ncbi:uncharacterized protein LOC124337500 [Daphnia pulicaria]|uniref:uncharacterized protein LOC124337500 n=1 Tax=Daphnia pulicaria TaxID=35523 RepID=UPI001EEB9ED7|nr:uncharacterized protein LOC124337500 [Daphnia pulicaria]XP_046647467.1 uncharacterized protein LOC124337500 [Daphnia pulicaria]